MNCNFCKIVQGLRPANIVYENKIVIAFLAKDPTTDGHTLIIPKKNIRDIHSLDKTTGGQIMKVAQKLANALEKTFGFDGIEIRAVSGHFQDVPHFHLHVFGRNKTNDIKIIYPQGINGSHEYLAQNAKKIKDALK